MFDHKNISINQFGFLLIVLLMSNSTSAETFSESELEQNITSTKQQYEACSVVLTKIDRNDAHLDAVKKCARVCSTVHNVLRRARDMSREIDKESVSDYIKQCNGFYAQLPSNYQNEAPLAKKTPEDAPKNNSAVIADLRRFSEEFRVIASKLSGRGDRRSANENAKDCENYAAYIQKHGLNEASENYWPTCYNNLAYTKDHFGFE